MKHPKKFFLVVLSISILIGSALTAYAAARWSYLVQIDMAMDFSGDYAKASISCAADGNDVDKITAKCELQKFDGSWKTVKSWTESRDSAIIRYDKSYPVPKNYSYRLKLTTSAYKGSKLLEQVTETSTSKFFR